MSFVNTILDSLGNSLVVTAVGGGPEVIPFLTGEVAAELYCFRLPKLPGIFTRSALCSVRRLASVLHFPGRYLITGLCACFANLRPGAPLASDRCWPLYTCQVLYSFATQRFSRAKLFNIVIFTFMLWFALFGALYPSHETVHFHGLAETVLLRLPAGLAGLVGMVRHLRVPVLFCQARLSVLL